MIGFEDIACKEHSRGATPHAGQKTHYPSCIGVLIGEGQQVLVVILIALCDYAFKTVRMSQMGTMSVHVITSHGIHGMHRTARCERSRSADNTSRA